MCYASVTQSSAAYPNIEQQMALVRCLGSDWDFLCSRCLGTGDWQDQAAGALNVPRWMRAQKEQSSGAVA